MRWPPSARGVCCHDPPRAGSTLKIGRTLLRQRIERRRFARINMNETNLPTFDNYRIIEAIGGGSYGQVYLVEKLGSAKGDRYALKWQKAPATHEMVARFQNEVWALRQLDHQAIPKLIDQGSKDGRDFFVMTLASGLSLRKLYQAQCHEGAPCSVMKVLAVIEAVLDALAHMHSKNICHRDVKDDNIVANASASEVHLIDLGCCRGDGQPAEHQTFWGVGASKYSPPDKLQHPTAVNPTHDVFAVGVVGYLLLTNEYPWSVGQSDDRGILEQKMRNEAPLPIAQVTPFVQKEVSDFIMRMLTIDDNLRPSAADARDEITRLRAALSAGKLSARTKEIAFPRVIRDPVHGDIRMTEFEWELMNSGEMQRLRWIKQLGLTHLVYPGAEHSRLNHSMGAMHVADRILRAIEDTSGQRMEPERRLLARTYALIHDVTHVAYGHTLEDELGILSRHDENSSRAMRLVLSNKSEVGELLRSTEFGRAVLDYFDPAMTDRRVAYLDELLSGPVGADVLDYIDRDSFFCGLDHKIDTAIYRRFSLGPIKSDPTGIPRVVSRLYGGHGVRLDAELALESVLLNRFALFMKVYTHPKKTAAGAMLGKAVASAMQLKGKNNIKEIDLEWLSDVGLLEKLRASSNSGVKELVTNVSRRQLYKIAFRADALSADSLSHEQYLARQRMFQEKNLFSPDGRRDIESKLAKKCGVPEHHIVVYVSGKAPGYQKVRQYVSKLPGKTEPRDEIYSPYRRIIERHLSLWKVYVFTQIEDDKKRAHLGELSEDFLSLPNDLGTDRRQGILFGR